MNLTAKIIDSASGLPLSGATISVNGTAVAIANSAGTFSIPEPAENSTITFSYVGYSSQSMPADILYMTPQIQLEKKSGALPDVVVTATRVLQNNPLILPAAFGLGLLLLSNDKKNKMKKVGKIDTTTILLIGGGLLAVYMLSRPKQTAPIYQQPAYIPPGYPGSQPQNEIAQDINAGSGAIKAIADLFNSF